MSTLEGQQKVQAAQQGQHPVPPVGEEIHLPSGSVLPLTTAVGITMMVIGTTIWWVWSLIGAIIFVGSVGMWIRDARHEFEHLPEDLDE